MSVINVRKAELNKRGIKDFEEWKSRPNTLYIGRNMSFYVKGAIQSKWANPFSVKKYGLSQCLHLYEEYIKSSSELSRSLEELRGKELGCWCRLATSEGEVCHGDILLRLLSEK